MAHKLISDRLLDPRRVQPIKNAVRLLATNHPDSWPPEMERIAAAFQMPDATVRRQLATAVQRWQHSPRSVVSEALTELSEARNGREQGGPNAARTTRPSTAKNAVHPTPSEVANRPQVRR